LLFDWIAALAEARADRDRARVYLSIIRSILLPACLTLQDKDPRKAQPIRWALIGRSDFSNRLPLLESWLGTNQGEVLNYRAEMETGGLKAGKAKISIDGFINRYTLYVCVWWRGVEGVGIC
jgi:hypothetical protein